MVNRFPVALLAMATSTQWLDINILKEIVLRLTKLGIFQEIYW